MTDANWPNVVTMLFAQAARHGDRPLLWAKKEGEYRSLSWREVASRVVALARGLTAIGISRGDRVVIVSENRPEWLIADFAVMASGGVSVPAYTTNTVADHQHVLDNSGAKAVIVSNAKLATNILRAAHRVAETSLVIMIDKPHFGQQPKIDILWWNDVVSSGTMTEIDIEQAAAGLTRDDLACLIYTSGTGGAPKGVMLHHGALLHNVAGAADALSGIGLDDVVYLSYLPLSHSYEHTAGQFFAIAVGAQIYYAEGVDTLLTNIAEARPTIMAAVPRLFETLHQRTLRRLRGASPTRRALFQRALDIGMRRHANPRTLRPWERLFDPLLDRLVRDKVRGAFGGRTKALVSGGGPLNPELGTFFQALGLPVLQGYGQTEAGPIISVNRPGRAKIHTVGPPLRDTDVKIAEDGEILVRGELVMRGYWRNEDATKQAIRDGWLYTGDIGRFDDDGHLLITDRKKDIIVNSGGDNISPARVEGMLAIEREIAQAVVFGDRRPHLIALIVPDAEWLATWAKETGKPIDAATLAADGDLRAKLTAVIDGVNRHLSVIERVRRFALIPEAFSIDNGQLTPTLKIRRHVIAEKYAAVIEGLYH